MPILNGCVEQAASDAATRAAQPSAPADTALASLIQDYRAFFQTQMAVSLTPGAALVIVQGDSILWMEGFGVKNTANTEPVDVHTVFRIGSLSKGFASVLTGMLVQDGYLEWEQRVQDCYPAFCLRDPAQAANIRLWHLLSHTTGLPYHAFTNLIEKGFSTDRIVREYFPQAPLGGKEGEFYAYQNTAFCVIEPIMQAATQQSYPQLLQSRIFTPVGMTDASCDYQSIQCCPNKCLPHFWTGYQYRPDSISELYYNAAAAGGVNASISDMGAWLKLLLGQRPELVADTILDRIFRPVVETGKERRILGRWIDRDQAAYALGWRVLQHESDTILYHSGYVNGFRGEIALCRKDNIGICVLMNASTDLSSQCVPAFFDRWNRYKKSRPQQSGNIL